MLVGSVLSALRRGLGLRPASAGALFLTDLSQHTHTHKYTDIRQHTHMHTHVCVGWRIVSLPPFLSLASASPAHFRLFLYIYIYLILLCVSSYYHKPQLWLFKSCLKILWPFKLMTCRRVVALQVQELSWLYKLKSCGSSREVFKSRAQKKRKNALEKKCEVACAEPTLWTALIRGLVSAIQRLWH